MSNLIIKNSIKQSKIVELLAKTRGGNAEQIARALYQKNTPAEMTKTYELLKKLELKGLIDYFVYKDDSVQKRFYFLSRKGLVVFQDFFNIEEGTKGTGVFGDFGYFKYAIYMPKSNQIKHLLMCVEAMIDVYILMSNYPENEIDFAHNLYAANDYVKADFVIVKSKQIYFVEIDRMHERGIALTNKFERYNKYFNTKNEVSLPKSIYFVVPNSKRKKEEQFDPNHIERYKSVVKACIKECCDYVEKVDLCFMSISDFLGILKEDLLPAKVNLKIIDHLSKNYTNDFEFSWNKHTVYFIKKDNRTFKIITEINRQCTKIWYDLLNIQNNLSEKADNGGILEFTHHIPKIEIRTNKKNLTNMIEFNKLAIPKSPDNKKLFLFQVWE